MIVRPGAGGGGDERERESVRSAAPTNIQSDRPDWRLFDLERGVASLARRPAAKILHAFPVEGDGVNIVARHRTYSPLRRRGGGGGAHPFSHPYAHFCDVAPRLGMG